jgi:CYTH domain-containing protein
MPEIEKKFRLSAMPTAEILGEGVTVLQGYLFAERGELRVRRKGNRHFLTAKGEGSLSRDE